MKISSQAAEFLLSLRLDRRTAADIPSNLKPEKFAEAYEIQRQLVEQLRSRSQAEQIGYKVACTNEAAQKALNLDGPFFGTLLSSSTHQTPAKIQANTFAFCCVEAEFAFQMAVDAAPGEIPFTAESIRECVASVLPAIEIVSTYFEDWTKVGALALAADNAIHGAWFPGESYADWRKLDLATHQVELFVNGERVREGSGAAVLGDPYIVLAWLANELPKSGRILKAGEFVSTGLATDIYIGSATDRIHADFGRLGTVELELLA